jgi:hypothetical protein
MTDVFGGRMRPQFAERKEIDPAGEGFMELRDNLFVFRQFYNLPTFRW